MPKSLAPFEQNVSAYCAIWCDDSGFVYAVTCIDPDTHAREFFGESAQ